MTHLSYFRLLTIFLANFSEKFNLLVLCEDIESSPGPRSNSGKSFSICHWNLTDIAIHNFSKFSLLTMKILGCVYMEKENGDRFDPPCGFPKNVFFRERLKPSFFGTFNGIISYIFFENLIEIPQVVKKLRRFFSLKITFHQFFGFFQISLSQRN